ncbi:right-handed parallel beta-helix repeat-containing protein [Sphingomonas abietis]|uniref:Right-handed parallel beta-helix repeat-containing protein n=1 Tax=Sphingomonas abietis TaxID=3012344 RepID=A0ABY7NP57_9SPHN|nr:right-handed parallel beta-helix repeat-containing protein [Sphingomonas abietis]WBO22730.1 right-handed parallel beta-helix repeat-containing protein [Sphingomonas abietis]
MAIALDGVLGLIGEDQAVASPGSNAEPCIAMTRLVGGVSDVGPALQACLDATPANGKVALPPGRYLIATPIHLRLPITLTTLGLSPVSAPCSADERRCAQLHLAIAPAVIASAIMPFDIASDYVRLDHLVFQGTRLTDPGLSAKRCASDKERPMAGGLRVSGTGIVIHRSVFRDMACYTALEFGHGAATVISGNDFVGNGTHTAKLRWADGLTIHDAKGLRVLSNRFRDNTDIQLVLGGCTGCTVADNRFGHSDAAGGGSFGEIMLQAWPKATSGNFTGTRVVRNKIDCGPQRRCGFGIMIGSTPWYDAPAFGGIVAGNRVAHAMLALNVDRLTGPMAIDHNQFIASPGTYPSTCGPRRVDVAVNVSPDSRPFLSSAMPASAISYRGCILNYAIVPEGANAPTSN